jgi:hypothetical protein
MLGRDMRHCFVVAVVEELLGGTYHIDQLCHLLNIDFPNQALAILLSPEGFCPIAYVAEIYEGKYYPEVLGVEEKAIATKGLKIHAFIVV